ncbi:MAG: VCBS repeat-containing protein [Chitinophagaceae bacterium]
MRPINLIVPLSLLVSLAGCSDAPEKLFTKIPASESGVDFINQVTENDSINPIKMEFLYNGGGVAVGDFNNDSLEDLYFTASMGPNKLYLNSGGFRFLDVTASANVTGEGMWSNGATVVDINNDGLEDIYVSTSIRSVKEGRRNLFYINQGPDKNGIPVFRDMAAEYGLADTSFSVQAVFFDYDRDGDLDMYLTTTKPTSRNTYTFGNRKDSSHTDFDKLYRNDRNESINHPVFTDVSLQAGIGEKGYGLGVTVGDLNNDGWPDIYVTNDFISSDHLYINNRDGTFTNRVKQSLRHTSQNAMGNDINDINNDGWADLVAVDMNPEDNFRKQKNMGAANYGKYRNMADFGYSLQFVRNTLQVNQGEVGVLKDSLIPYFSDISYYAGVAETDWSWTPSVADFDNDGMKDLFITNGYPKDVTDHDYMAYRQDKGYIVPEKTLLGQIPEINVANYAYQNTPELQFIDVSKAWGLDDMSYSAGAAYADLDNDGDLDYIINNTNGPASLYKNNSDHTTGKNNYLSIRFTGDTANSGGIGAKAIVYYSGRPHVQENFPTRGYLSCMSQTAHFGLGSAGFADSIQILWPDGRIQNITRTPANQLINVHYKNAIADTIRHVEPQSRFTDITGETGISYVHEEFDFIDFDYQKLLPHKLSQFGPALAAGDIDNNGLDDLFVSGPKGKSAIFFLQQANGSFIRRPFQQINHPSLKPWEETGVLMIDLDNDQDLDLYLCSGSVEFPKNDAAYRDRVFTNDGKGNFTEQSHALPDNLSSKLVLKAADFDNDGDADLFIGSRSIPNEFPVPASGFIYRNDSRKGQLRFTDVTKQIAPGLKDLGLLTDATWTDFNGDGKTDLLVCGEFMPVTFFANTNGTFVKTNTGVEQFNGLFNSITPADIDNDGRMDYIVGNLGLNTFYRASASRPFTMYGKDFDGNGSFDAIPFLFLKDNHAVVREFPAFTRDDMFKQMARVKGQFPTYKFFAEAGLTEILSEEERRSALKVSASFLQSAVIRNRGNGRFEMVPLPYQAQWSPVYGILAEDFNHDGYLDLLLATNDLGTEVNTGQYDASYGLLLEGTGNGSFNPRSLQESGFFIPSNGKAIVRFNYQDKYTIAISQNQASLQVYRLNGIDSLIHLAPGEVSADRLLTNGKTRHEEFWPGSTFLSQNSRTLLFDKSTIRIKINSVDGRSRVIAHK